MAVVGGGFTWDHGSRPIMFKSDPEIHGTKTGLKGSPVKNDYPFSPVWKVNIS